LRAEIDTLVGTLDYGPVRGSTRLKIRPVPPRARA
jgi:acetoacetate decarboxylase